MYVQSGRGQARRERGRGNAIRAGKCVATTACAFCLDAGATISSTASTAATSVTVVRSSSVLSRSFRGSQYPGCPPVLVQDMLDCHR